jgi:hypothetical protein
LYGRRRATCVRTAAQSETLPLLDLDRFRDGADTRHERSTAHPLESPRILLRSSRRGSSPSPVARPVCSLVYGARGQGAARAARAASARRRVGARRCVLSPGSSSCP